LNTPEHQIIELLKAGDKAAVDAGNFDEFMNSEVKMFLESGLLEEYLFGLCEESDRIKVEAYINKYPEIRAEYERLQDGVERYAKEISIPPPAGTKEEIMTELDRIAPDSPASPAVARSSFNRWIGMAAVLLGLLSFWFWSQWSAEQKNSKAYQQQFVQLQQDCEQEKRQSIALQEKLDFLSHPGSRKLVLKSENAALAFEAVAYWNDARQSSFMEIIEHPKLKNKECLQLWADIDGKMVSLGIIPEKNQHFYELPFKLHAESLNITIEPQGGSDHPNVARLLTSVSI